MSEFVGRNKEIQHLNDIYSREGLKTCVILGRRQIGKSTLIREFCKDKESLIIQSYARSGYENRVMMSKFVSMKAFGESRIFDSYTEIMDLIENICKAKKTVLVFDEYPFLVNSSPEFPSILQRLIDTQLLGTETMVIICGSSISAMNDEMSYDRPLYGRFMKKMELREITFDSTLKLHGNMECLDALKTYLVVGGVPKYHQILSDRTFKKAIMDNFFSINGELRDEAQNMITCELPSDVFTAIVSCIADGSVVQYEIADKLHIDRSICKKYLDKLESIMIVEKVNPMMDRPSRPRYRIRDNLVAFYYEVVRKYENEIEDMYPPEMIYKHASNDIDTFLGHRFESFCGNFLSSEYCVSKKGPWWSRDGEVEFDLLAKIIDSELRTSNLVCECKFVKNPIGMNVINKLKSKADKNLKLENVSYILFSASGFDEELSEFAQDKNIRLIGLDNFINWPKEKMC